MHSVSNIMNTLEFAVAGSSSSSTQRVQISPLGLLVSIRLNEYLSLPPAYEYEKSDKN